MEQLWLCAALTLASIALPAIPARSAHDPADPAWGCYDPEPGHPTAAERTAFFERIAGAARLAEQRHGVPAAGLAAMAMLESGYGFTRTAQFANNLFGWKVRQTDTGGYVLTCQPASDPGNHYRRFASWDEALDQVGRRLGAEAMRAEYRQATDDYQRERVAGLAVPEVMLHWVQRIQKGGYNPDPAYVGRVVRIANNYQSPGSKPSPSLNLYQLSETASLTPATLPAGGLNPGLSSPPSSLPEQEVADLTRYFAKRRPYMRQDCHPVAAPGYEAVPTGPEQPVRCTYQMTSTSPKAKVPGAKQATADVIFPASARMARWIVDSCLWAGGTDLPGCIALLAKSEAGILGQSSAQFPIAGIVFEDMAAGLMKGYVFRDGLTAKIEGWSNGSEAPPTPEQTEAGLTQAPSWLSEHARVARADIGDIKCLDPSAAFDPKHRDQRWRDYVRTRFVEAMQGDHNLLLLAQVFAHYHPQVCRHS